MIEFEICGKTVIELGAERESTWFTDRNDLRGEKERRAKAVGRATIYLAELWELSM